MTATQVQERRSATLPIDVWLAASCASVPKARRLVRRAVTGRFPDEAADRLEVVVSELVTNAAKHAGSTGIHLSVTDAWPGALRIECWDASAGAPEPVLDQAVLAASGDAINIAELAEDGRGLFLSKALSNVFGCRAERTGKTMISVIDSAEPR